MTFKFGDIVKRTQKYINATAFVDQPFMHSLGVIIETDYDGCTVYFEMPYPDEYQNHWTYYRYDNLELITPHT